MHQKEKGAQHSTCYHNTYSYSNKFQRGNQYSINMHQNSASEIETVGQGLEPLLKETFCFVPIGLDLYA